MPSLRILFLVLNIICLLEARHLPSDPYNDRPSDISQMQEQAEMLEDIEDYSYFMNMDDEEQKESMERKMQSQQGKMAKNHGENLMNQLLVIMNDARSSNNDDMKRAEWMGTVQNILDNVSNASNDGMVGKEWINQLKNVLENVNNSSGEGAARDEWINKMQSIIERLEKSSDDDQSDNNLATIIRNTLSYIQGLNSDDLSREEWKENIENVLDRSRNNLGKIRWESVNDLQTLLQKVMGSNKTYMVQGVWMNKIQNLLNSKEDSNKNDMRPPNQWMRMFQSILKNGDYSNKVEYIMNRKELANELKAAWKDFIDAALTAGKAVLEEGQSLAEVLEKTGNEELQMLGINKDIALAVDSPLGKALATSLGQVAGQLAGSAGRVGGSLAKLLGVAGDAVVDTLDGALTVVLDGITAVERAVADATTVLNLDKAATRNVTDALIRQAVKHLGEKIVEFLKLKEVDFVGAVSGLEAEIERKMGVAEETVKDMEYDVMGALTRASGVVQGFVGGLADKMWSLFLNTPK